jgi:dolichol-phosphate mannosyltransferase
MCITIIIPTFNEREAIIGLLEGVDKEIGGISNHEIFVLVVDGNSSDGTASVVKEKARLYKNLYLLEEKKKGGLGIAYAAGMKYAIEKLGAEALIEFDGDGQHDPKDIRRLIKEFDDGYDYVIGSRYVRGGSVPAGWAWYRKLLSKYGSLFIRWALWLPTYDNTSGFKLSRVKGFAGNLPFEEDKLFSRRHAYKVQFLHQMIKMGAKTKEIPIAFLQREKGDSKSAAEDIFESLKVIFLIWIKSQSF